MSEIKRFIAKKYVFLRLKWRYQEIGKIKQTENNGY